MNTEQLVRRSHRHLVALGESDRDAGHGDESLVRLLRDWADGGHWGGATVCSLADDIEESKIPSPDAAIPVGV